jgi:flagellar motor switch protein FliN/FliY
MTDTAQSEEIYAETPANADDHGATATRTAALLALPVSVAISVGKAKSTIEQLLAIKAGSILPLDTKVDDPVELIVGERVIAWGRLVEIDGADSFGVEIIGIAEGDSASPER